MLIAVLAMPFGFSLYPLHLLAGLALLGVFGIGIGALSISLALLSKNREWLFWSVQQSLMFPLLILSGMMLPLESGPGWMQTAAQFNPLTYIVEAERALLGGSFTDPAVLWGLIAAMATCIIGVALGIRATRRTI